MSAIDPNRLYSMLLNTGLQTKDNALYQVIYNLIGSLAQTNKVVNNISTGSTTVINQNILQLPFDDPIEGPQGPIGITGATGAIGPQGPQGIQGVIGLDGNDGEDSLIPGPIGPTGASGSSSSSSGNTVILPDIETYHDLEFPITIPSVSKYYIAAYRIAAQTIPSGSSTTIGFQVVDFGDSTILSGSTDFVIPVEGIYYVNCHITYDTSSSGQRILFATVNGTNVNGGGSRFGPPNGVFSTSVIFNALLHLKVSDRLNFLTFQDSGGNLNIISGASPTIYNARASLVLLAQTYNM